MPKPGAKPLPAVAGAAELAALLALLPDAVRRICAGEPRRTIPRRDDDDDAVVERAHALLLELAPLVTGVAGAPVSPEEAARLEGVREHLKQQAALGECPKLTTDTVEWLLERVENYREWAVVYRDQFLALVDRKNALLFHLASERDRREIAERHAEHQHRQAQALEQLVRELRSQAAASPPTPSAADATTEAAHVG